MLWETIQFYNDLFFFRCLVNQKSTFCQLIWFERSLSQPQQVSILGKEHTRGLNNQIHVHITHTTQHTLHQTPMIKIDNSSKVFRRISRDFIRVLNIFFSYCVHITHATQHTLHQTPMNKIDNLNTIFRRISKDFSFKYIFLILCIELSTNDHFSKLKL